MRPFTNLQLAQALCLARGFGQLRRHHPAKWWVPNRNFSLAGPEHEGMLRRASARGQIRQKVLNPVGDAPFAFTARTMSCRSLMLRASLSMRVTVSVSPLRKKSRTVRSSSRPAVVVPLRFSDRIMWSLIIPRRQGVASLKILPGQPTPKSRNKNGLQKNPAKNNLCGCS